MRKDLDNRITPHESVILLCQQYPDIVKAITGFESKFGTYASLTADVRNRLQKTERSTRSLTNYKNDLKETLSIEATRLATKIQLSSHINNNARMMDNIYTNKSELQRQGEEPMIARMKILVERAAQHEKELMDLGVTTEEVKTLSDKIATFEDLSGAPVRERQSRATSINRIEEKLTELRTFFTQQIEPFVSSESLQFPDFHADFMRKKRVIHSRHSKKHGPSPEVTIATVETTQTSTLSEQLLRSIESVVNANSSVVGLAPSNGHKPGEVLQAGK
jgi:hypothetical protein